MSTILNDKLAQQATDHLTQADPKLAPVIARAGLCPRRPHREYYRQLVRSIIVQQLSIKVADVIYKRFCELFGGNEFPTPEAILEKSVEDLRGVGLSRAKGAYIRDLAQHVVDGKVKFNHLDNLSNDEIVAELTDVKGIGEWTAHMFLMFCMGRADVLAPGDLGIRNAIKKLYGLKETPSPDQVKLIAERNHWHPYETVACWYLWQSLDNAPS
jgi:DNA-3-methyladenine glycosylase II